jgi:hypothetical protein
MGDTYTRQSTYTDGDVITAAHTNDEFNQLLAAFAVSSGHTHDGTAAEGGPVTKLLGNTLTFGAGTADTDITITFDGESADGVLKWMEDEDYFEFSDDILIASTEKIQFRDTAIYINSSTDGQLDLVADTEIQIAATTIDINGLVDISGNLSVGGNLDVTGTFDLSDSNFTNAGDIQLDSISGDGDTNTSITFSGSDVITVANAGTNQVTFNDGSISPVTDSDVDLGTTSLRFKDVYVDSITATDQITATGFTGTLDGILGSGSAAAASVTTLAASGAITGSSTVQGTTVTATTAFVPGTSDGATLGTTSLEFGDLFLADSSVIYLGADQDVTLTHIHNDGILLNSTRQLQFGDSGTYIHQSADGVLDLVSDTEIEINATTIDINGAVDMSSTLAVAGVLTGASLDISGDVDVDGTTNLDIVDIDGAVNIAADTTIASTNKIIFNDASQFIHAPSTTVLDIAATDEIELTATLVDVVGNFTNSGTIVSAGVVTANAGVVVDEMTLDADTLTATDDFIIDAAGNIEINADGGTITFKDASSTLGTVTSSGFSGTTAVATTVVVTDSTANTNFPVVFNNESNGLLDDTSAFIYNPSSGTLSVANLVVSGDTTTNSSTNLTIADPLVKYGQGSTGTSVDQGFIVTRGDGSSSNTANRGFIWDESADEFATIAANTEAGTTAGNVTINDYAPLHVGAITADDASTFTAGASFGDANITNVGNIALDSITADGSTITITGNTTFADGSFDFDIASHDTSNGLKLGGTLVSATAAELNKLDGVTATTAELNILAGVNTTAAELNKLDGGTSATSTTIVDADRVVLNDNGTIVQVAVSDIKTYIGAATADDATALAIALG